MTAKMSSHKNEDDVFVYFLW